LTCVPDSGGKGFGAAFPIHFTKRKQLRHYRDTFDDDHEWLRRFLLEALEERVYLLPEGRFYTSISHTEEDVTE